jgi:two-component system response regulator PrrA
METSIIVVASDPEFLVATEAVLTLDGCRVRLAADGRAALRAIDDHRPTAVIVDIGLPVLDGWFVVADIARRHVPVTTCVWGERLTALDQLRAESLGAHVLSEGPVVAIEVRSHIAPARSAGWLAPRTSATS